MDQNPTDPEMVRGLGKSEIFPCACRRCYSEGEIAGRMGFIRVGWDPHGLYNQSPGESILSDMDQCNEKADSFYL